MSKRVRFEDEGQCKIAEISPTHADLEAASSLLADMLSLVDDQITVRTAAQNVAHMRALVANLSEVQLQACADKVLALPTGRLRDLYNALDKYGFERAIEAIHGRLRDCLVSGLPRRMTMSEVLRAFDCHPGVAMAISQVGDDWQVENKRLAEEARTRRLAVDGPTDDDLLAMIGTLLPGQCVFIACDGGYEDALVDPDFDDDKPGCTTSFGSGALICRAPTRIRFPSRPKLRLRKSAVNNAGLPRSAFAAMSEDEQKAAKAEYLDQQRWKAAVESAELAPPLVAGGVAGAWLRYFIATLRKPDNPCPASLCPWKSESLKDMEYIVMQFPAPCGPGQVDMEVSVHNPDDWVGDDYTMHGDIGDEEASACRTLVDALDAADLGRVELVVKAVERGAPVQVLHRTARVDPDADHLTVG